MKNLFKILAMFLLCMFVMQSCEDAGEDVDTSLDSGSDPDGDSSTGGDTGEASAPNLVSVMAGYNRAEVKWLINGNESDVKYCYIYYTDEDGKERELLASALKSTDTLSASISSLSDGVYSVVVKNYYESTGTYSEASAPVEVEVYGDEYAATLASRSAEATYTVGDGGVISWGEIGSDFVGSDISYMDKTGATITGYCGADEDETIITDIYGGTTVSYKSYFLYAENALDTLSASSLEVQFPVDPDEVIEVQTLKALMPYLKMSDVSVKLAPGTYQVTTAGFATGEYGAVSEVVEDSFKLVLFLVEGDGSTYDFTDVEVQIDTDIFRYLAGYSEFCNLQSTGSRNHVIGLTLRDVTPDGDIEFNNGGCTNIIMDGYANKFENITLYSTGSYPYGYGECFGKGGGNTIAHDKHCGFLIRGLSNHAYRCNVTHYSYGHCVFMQAASYPTIEECIIQSEMTTTDAILAEKGTGSAADLIDFLTTWGHTLQPGYTIACSEEGIRAYNAGETMVNGVRIERGTDNPTILNCYIKTARAGVTLTHASGTKYVEGTTAIGCDRGFCIGSGDIVDCYADCSYGPAYGVDYTYNSGINVDITLVPNELPLKSGNGSKHAAIIIGGTQNITFRNYVDGELVPTYDSNPTDNGVTGYYDYATTVPYSDPRQPNLAIQIGGDNRTVGMWESDDNYTASNITLNNETGYRIILDDNSSNCTITTAGPYEDYGSGNKVTGGTNEYGTTPQPDGETPIYGGNTVGVDIFDLAY